MSANLGWKFYKEYFENINYIDMNTDAVKSSNQILIEQKVNKLIETKVNIISRDEDELLGNSHFKATTTYPGLLLGIGNGHELPSVKGQAILGFHFDYTTGLPEITGSSIKGVLRSAFNKVDNYGYIKELLYDKMELEKDPVDIHALELEIFGQINGSDNILKGRDIFFDAYITNTITTILGDDYITPHGDNPLIEPTPLRFIKVMPQVTFMFDFELCDGVLSIDNKELLFRLIIQDLGLGAKTNVGYGYFEEISIDKFKEVKRIKDTLTGIANESPIDKIFKEYNNNMPNLVGSYTQSLSERFKDSANTTVPFIPFVVTFSNVKPASM